MLALKYKSVIKSIAHPFEGIYTLEFATLGRPYKYLPGQFLHLALDYEYDGTGQWPDSRCFSMQSNPNEETIRISYSVKGEFTKQMEKLLKEGSEVWLKLPYGDLFQQPHSKQNTVFIAGGTGITPFLSLFTDESFYQYNNPILYAGFRSVDMNLYHKELEYTKIKNPGFFIKLVYQNINGIMNIAKIHKESTPNSSFFISGPPVMIKSFKKALIAIGVEESRVLTDDWE